MASKTKVAGISATVIAASIAISLPWVKQSEGLSLKSYEDVVGVWTVCYGHAYVPPGIIMTKSQCDAQAATDDVKFTNAVVPMLDPEPINIQPHPQEILAAYVHFAVNIGVEGFKKSQTLAFEKQGDLPESCQAMMNWLTLNGKDCSKFPKVNGCKGLINRRTEERNICLKGTTP